MPRPELRLDVGAVAGQRRLYQARAPEWVEGLAPGWNERGPLLAQASGTWSPTPRGHARRGTLRLRASDAEGGVVVEVADTGPGLDEDQRTRLFTPYYTTKKGGTGLGLAIVQGIVSDHAGRIEARSAPGEGTTFSLYLPRDPAAVVSSPPVRERPA